MIPFKPRRVSIQFFFIFETFHSSFNSPRSQRNLEKKYLLQFIGFSKGMSKREEIGKIKFMNIDYSRLGHAGHVVGLQLLAKLKKNRKVCRTSLIQSRWCWIGVEINFTLVSFLFIRKTIMIKIGFSWSDFAFISRNQEVFSSNEKYLFLFYLPF